MSITRYHMWCDNHKCGVLFTLWNHKITSILWIFGERGLWKGPFALHFYQYDGPMFNWSFFCYISVVKNVWQNGSYFTKHISIKMLTTDSLGSEWFKQTHATSQPFSDHFLKTPPIEIQVKSTGTNTWADLTRWRHDMKHFPHYWRFVRRIQLLSLMPAWTSSLSNSRSTSNLR